MKILDFFRPNREILETRNAYTDALTAQIVADANAENVVSGDIALSELCAGMWGRAFASATVDPKTPVTAALSASVLETIGRQLILDGEAVFEIVFDGRVMLNVCSSWNIVSPDIYELTITQPHRVFTRYRSPDAVLHLQYGRGIRQPWKSDGPLHEGGTSLDLANTLEQRLREEVAGTVGHVLPSPDTAASNKGLQTDISNLKGKTVMVPTMSGGYGDGVAQAPRGDWEPKRLGANPPKVLCDLRNDVQNSIIASAGIPPALLDPESEGTGLRESYRQFVHNTIIPVGKIIAEEIENKLEVSNFRLRFEDLEAADTQGRARAAKSLVDSGVDLERALAMTGFN